MSPEDVSDVDFVLDRNLLYYDGDKVTLLWNPSDIINPDLVTPTDYFVDVEVYWYDVRNSSWNFFKTLARGLNNTGVMNLSNVPTGPDRVEDYIVPMAFRIVLNAENSSLIPNFLLPFFERREVGIWSSIAFKVTSNGQESSVPGLCSNWIMQENSAAADDVVSIPCPCNVRQARRVNSGFFELRSQRHASLRSFFNPSAENCFISTLLG